MMSKIALCADSQCLNDPATLGLKGERILDQTWIVPFADALIARKYLREPMWQKHGWSRTIRSTGSISLPPSKRTMPDKRCASSSLHPPVRR